MSYVVVFFMGLITSFAVCFGHHKPARPVVVILNPPDGDRWTDDISNGFVSELIDTNLMFARHVIGWTPGESDENILKSVELLKPDLVFLPNNSIISRFSEIIAKKTNAKIVFASCVFDESEMDKQAIDRDLGVYSFHPIRELVEQARKLKPINSIGVVSGPLSRADTLKISEVLKGLAKVDITVTDNIETYRKKAQQFAHKYDAVMAIASLAIKDAQGNWVSKEQLGSVIDSIDQLTMGYGQVPWVNRTIEVNIDPYTIGKHAAHITYSYLIDHKAEVKIKENSGLRISKKSIQRLNLKVPKSLKKYVQP